MAAATIRRDVAHILLDGSSTVSALADELGGFEKLWVTMPDINTLQELPDSECVEVDCVGGGSVAFRKVLLESSLRRP